MKILILSFLSLNLWAQNSLPQTPSVHDPRPPVLQNNNGSSLFDVKLLPGKKQLVFEVVGKTAGKVTLDKITVQAILNFGKKESQVPLNKKDNLFVLPQAYKGPIQVHVKDEVSGKTEKFDFDIKP